MKNPPIPVLKDMSDAQLQAIVDLTETRILKISKDDLRMEEQQLMWSEELEGEVYTYWNNLNAVWKLHQTKGLLPDCTCADYENGFLARSQYNPYFYDGEPCSMKYFEKWKADHADK